MEGISVGGIVTSTRKQRKTETPDGKSRAILCAQTAADTRGRDVVVLDMRDVVKWVDFIVIATGSSRRQIAAIADEIEAALSQLGETKTGIEGYELGSWIVLDYGDLLIHVFNDEKRDYYQLEHLWGDAPRIAWQRPEDAATAQASETAEQPHTP
jgi:ribosome-associated protein